MSQPISFLFRLKSTIALYAKVGLIAAFAVPIVFVVRGLFGHIDLLRSFGIIVSFLIGGLGLSWVISLVISAYAKPFREIQAERYAFTLVMKNYEITLKNMDRTLEQHKLLTKHLLDLEMARVYDYSKTPALREELNALRELLKNIDSVSGSSYQVLEEGNSNSGSSDKMRRDVGTDIIRPQ